MKEEKDEAERAKAPQDLREAGRSAEAEETANPRTTLPKWTRVVIMALGIVAVWVWVNFLLHSGNLGIGCAVIAAAFPVREPEGLSVEGWGVLPVLLLGFAVIGFILFTVVRTAVRMWSQSQDLPLENLQRSKPGEEGGQQKAQGPGTGSGHRTKVLHLDDEKGFTLLMKLNLEATGRYEVRVENFPEHALAVMREFRPDIVLTCIMMPRMSGGEVAEAIRNDPELKDTPIVFLTATVRKSQVQEHGGIIGGYPFLAKPASLEEVIEAIDRYSRKPSSA